MKKQADKKHDEVLVLFSLTFHLNMGRETKNMAQSFHPCSL